MLCGIEKLRLVRNVAGVCMLCNLECMCTICRQPTSLFHFFQWRNRTEICQWQLRDESLSRGVVVRLEHI